MGQWRRGGSQEADGGATWRKGVGLCFAKCSHEDLEAKGFEGVDGLVIHVPGGSAVFDKRKLPSKRPYLKCVLAQAGLFAGGCEKFKSNGPQAYYKALLKNPKTLPGLPAIQYDEQLKELEDAADPPELMKLTAGPRKLTTVATVDPDIDGDADPPPEEPTPPPLQNDWGSSGNSHTSSSHASADGGSVDGDDGRGERDPYPEEIEGMRVSRESHLGRGDDGLRVQCMNPAHGNCSCYRSVKMWTDDFGIDAPVLFIKTWLSKSFSKTRDQHKRWRPGKNDVKLYMLANS